MVYLLVYWFKASLLIRKPADFIQNSVRSAGLLTYFPTTNDLSCGKSPARRDLCDNSRTNKKFFVTEDKSGDKLSYYNSISSARRLA